MFSMRDAVQEVTMIPPIPTRIDTNHIDFKLITEIMKDVAEHYYTLGREIAKEKEENHE